MDAQKEHIVPVAIEQELKTSFLDYSMSVIVSRALPDVRDGLKPVQRRILYTMHELGLVHNKGFRKSAAVVGDTMGKYHPHGDQAIYDTLVRMAQDWSFRYPLIDGQGNFGSVDGDSPAAMRYTEVRMAPITAEMLADIEKQTVDMQDNYDGRLQEPKVLPAAVPNLLVNGSQGIAVGMATSCPPHNLNEVCDAIVHLIDNPDAETRDLMRFIKGPDFPTGAIIYGTEGLAEAYATGRGKVQVRARAITEFDKASGKDRIVITEIPYQVNKSRLIESIAELVKNKEVEGITDLRDESDREGMRIVIEIRKGDEPQVILNQLYARTQLQDTFSILMLALVNNVPRVLSLVEMIRYFIEHRIEIVRRRTEYDLRQAEERSHIVEGLLRAIDHIDEIIAIIRASADVDVARENLKNRFGFSDAQANAILAMRLRRLTGLEREELEKEYQDLLKQIERFKMILSSRRTILAEVRREILEIKQKYGDDRRTEILGEAGEFRIEDFVADEEMVVTVSNAGYIKRVPVSSYRKQRRGGRGVTGADTKEEDFIRDLFVASAHQFLLFFTNKGQVYWRKVHELPKGTRTARGRAIVNVLDLSGDERVTACLPVRDLNEEGKFVFMVTRKGIVKKTELTAFSNPRSKGIRAIDLEKDDELVDIQITSGRDNILLATRRGMAIRFPETDVRPMGRSAQGVIGIRLEKDDYVIGTSIAHDDMTVLSVTENGFGKRTRAEEYRVQHRGGHGIINIKTTDRNGNVVGMLTVDDDDEIVVVSTDGVVIRLAVRDIRTIGRNTQGVKIMVPNPGAKVSAVARAVGERKEDKTTGAMSDNDSSTESDDEPISDDSSDPDA
ncbi:MAG TPA: DNA gyrase subunit A [Candidatus Hydrogenedentes bacterium]|nr:DNA gyrase subunit A [Candidatus Hydrogenedentota bacterium]HOL76831.1 DNA gyrase subunit A [Candidatus Hydrogenedentota bacterium]HPO86227.1 DNA gyrase subunit A [Candidatus Hydrogenedentota bacterium]